MGSTLAPMTGNTVVPGLASAAVVVAEGPGLVLVELSVVEQRYHAVMELLSGGVPVTEIAERYGVSRGEGRPVRPLWPPSRAARLDGWR